MDRLSERVGSTGSLQAEGLANILGCPPFDLLTLVLRESAQNIWDARLRDAGSRAPRMVIRVRTLTPSQAAKLRATLGSAAHSEREPVGTDDLARLLAAPNSPIRVLEIADFNTVGLRGGIDPRSHSGNFVRFFFDVGGTHFATGDGGTYGYGRSSLYLISRARTILVDSIPSDPQGERRFMGCRIGNSYQAGTITGELNRFTGRHFWGRRHGGMGGGIHPLMGQESRDVSADLGMPDRVDLASGTSILIPWPDLGDGPVADRIVEILLENLWPKMVPRDGHRPMEFEIEVDGVNVPLPDPCVHRIYRLFAESLTNARTRSQSLGALPVTRYTTALGHLAFASQSRTPPLQPTCFGDERPPTFATGVHHIALMRPSELVVRYLELPRLDDSKDWCGVFLCADDSEVRDAFARAEPPAHDDWVPDRLDGPDRSIVRVALRKIPEMARDRFAALSPSAGPESDVSLGAAGDRFAARFVAGDGTGPGFAEPPKTRGRGGRSLISAPEFDNLRVEQGRRIARFRFRAVGPTNCWVAAQPAIAMEGMADLPAEIEPPTVSGWLTPSGHATLGTTCHLGVEGVYFVDVEFNGYYAIALTLREEPS